MPDKSRGFIWWCKNTLIHLTAITQHIIGLAVHSSFFNFILHDAFLQRYSLFIDTHLSNTCKQCRIWDHRSWVFINSTVAKKQPIHNTIWVNGDGNWPLNVCCSVLYYLYSDYSVMMFNDLTHQKLSYQGDSHSLTISDTYHLLTHLMTVFYTSVIFRSRFIQLPSYQI